MAVAKIKKIQIIGHTFLYDKIVTNLHEVGVMEIIDLSQTDEKQDLVTFPPPHNTNVEETISRIEYIRNYISRFLPKKGFLESIAKPKSLFTAVQFNEIIENLDINQTYNLCKDLEKKLREAETKNNKLLSYQTQLLPWLSIEAPLADITPTEHTDVIAGTIPFKHIEGFENNIASVSEYVYLEKIYQSGKYAYLVILCHKEIAPKVKEYIKNYEFDRISYPSINATCKRLLKRVRQEILCNSRKKEELIKESSTLHEIYAKILLLQDYYINVKAKNDLNPSVGRTDKAFWLSGWVLESNAENVKLYLENTFNEIDIKISDPAEDEDVPVHIENKPVIEPFEVITNLYGNPAYYELDPTVYLAPFFFVFFGICLTDAGYGLVMLAASLLILKKADFGPSAKKFFKLIALGGLSTVIFGALSGGWFGLNIDKLPAPLSALRYVRLFDPLKNPLKFFIIALILGFIQIFTGIAVKMYDNIRLNRIKDALLDELPWLVILSGAVILGLQKAGFVPVFVGNIFMFASAVSAGVIILFKGRKRKNIFGRLMIGVFSLFGLFGFSGAVSYTQDVVSYARLFALGLATAALAQAINSIAVIFTGLIPVVGILVGVLIIIGGHLINLIINAFGGFIHTCRLQYVEYFTKFFEGGGRIFKPFKEQWENSVVK